MVTSKKATTLRLSDRHQSILDGLASDWNLSKNAVIEKLLDDATPHKSDITKGKVNNSNSLSHLNSDVTKAKSDVTLKGVEAERAILSGLVLHFKDKSKMLLLDDWLWTITKTANGSQKVINKYIYIPPSLSLGFSRSGLELPSLSEIVDNMAFYAELKEACASTGKDIENICPAYLALYVNERQKFRFLNEALEEDTSAVEPSSDEKVADAIQAPSTLHLEAAIEDKPTESVVAQLEQVFEATAQEQPKPLTKQQFRKKFGFGFDKAGNDAYGKACLKGRTKGWVAEDGSRWFTNADSKDGRWSTDKAAIASPQLESAM